MNPLRENINTSKANLEKMIQECRWIEYRTYRLEQLDKINAEQKKLNGYYEELCSTTSTITKPVNVINKPANVKSQDEKLQVILKELENADTTLLKTVQEHIQQMLKDVNEVKKPKALISMHHIDKETTIQQFEALVQTRLPHVNHLIAGLSTAIHFGNIILAEHIIENYGEKIITKTSEETAAQIIHKLINSEKLTMILQSSLNFEEKTDLFIIKTAIKFSAPFHKLTIKERSIIDFIKTRPNLPNDLVILKNFDEINNKTTTDEFDFLLIRNEVLANAPKLVEVINKCRKHFTLNPSHYNRILAKHIIDKHLETILPTIFDIELIGYIEGNLSPPDNYKRLLDILDSSITNKSNTLLNMHLSTYLWINQAYLNNLEKERFYNITSAPPKKDDEIPRTQKSTHYTQNNHNGPSSNAPKQDNIKSKYNQNNLERFENDYPKIRKTLDNLPEKFNELKTILQSHVFYQNPAQLFQKYGRTSEEGKKNLQRLTHPDNNFGFETTELYQFIVDTTYDLINSHK